MGRHRRVLTSLSIVFAVVASACGLSPADEELQGADGSCPAVDAASPVEIEMNVILNSVFFKLHKFIVLATSQKSASQIWSCLSCPNT